MFTAATAASIRRVTCSTLAAATLTIALAAHSALAGGPVATDFCADAPAIGPNIPGPYVGSTDTATYTPIDDLCHEDPEFTGAAGLDVWYRYTPATSGTMTLSTCHPATDFDSVLSVHVGNCTDLTQIACVDDLSPDTCTASPFGDFAAILTTNVVAGVTYHIRISGFFGDTGPYELTISGPNSVPLALINNSCDGRLPLQEGQTPFSTLGATTDGPQSGLCPPADTVKDIWYDYMPECSGTVTIDTCVGTNFDSTLAAYSGCQCPVTNDRLLACDDDGCNVGFSGESTITFNVVGGQCYKIRVGGLIWGPPNEILESGTGTLTVTFVQAPLTITCPPDVTGVGTSSDGTGDCSATVVDLGTPTASGCPPYSFANDHPSTTYPKGMTTVTWTVTDAHGDTATCTQAVTVIDDEPAVITDCPTNFTVGTSANGAGDCMASGSFFAPTVTDNCPNGLGIIMKVYVPPSSTIPDTSLAASSGDEIFYNIGVGGYRIEFVISDRSGVQTCQFLLTVVDDEPATVTGCMDDFTVGTSLGGTGNCVAMGTLVTPTVSDNCPNGFSMLVNAYSPPGNPTPTDSIPNVGSGETVIFTVPSPGARFEFIITDSTGVQTCDFVITVVDDEAPIINCPADPTFQCSGSGNTAQINAYIASVSAADNCDSSVAVTHVVNSATPGCGDTFTRVITFAATDDAGNTSTCQRTITIVDTTPPVPAFLPGVQSSVSVQCLTDVPNPSPGSTITGTDVCCDGGLQLAHVEDIKTPGPCPNSGTIVRVYSVTDGSTPTAGWTRPTSPPSCRASCPRHIPRSTRAAHGSTSDHGTASPPEPEAKSRSMDRRSSTRAAPAPATSASVRGRASRSAPERSTP